jgi:hypothetical protein
MVTRSVCSVCVLLGAVGRLCSSLIQTNNVLMFIKRISALICNFVHPLYMHNYSVYSGTLSVGMHCAASSNRPYMLKTIENYS